MATKGFPTSTSAAGAASSGGQDGGQWGGGQNQQQEQQQERLKQQEDMKNQILNSILSQEARARLNTLRIAKPEQGQMVENMLLNMYKMRGASHQISEDELIGLLQNLSERTRKETKVKFDRRRNAFSDDEDEDLGL